MKNTTNIKIAKKYEDAIESVEFFGVYFIKLNKGYEVVENYQGVVSADGSIGFKAQKQVLNFIRNGIFKVIDVDSLDAPKEPKSQKFAKGDTVVLTNSRGAKGLVWLNDFDLSTDTATVTKLGGIGAVTVSLGKICHTSEYADDLDTIREMLNEFNQQLAEQPLKGGK